MRRYYYAGTQRIAMRTGTDLKFLLGDHLGSTSVTALASGAFDTETRYYTWGEVRWASGAAPTDYLFTGQQEVGYINLYWYGSRWYDQSLGRFIQPDCLIPNPGNPQAYDRYSYVYNNPPRYVDPTGHFTEDQLVEWYGADWQDLFSLGWQTILLQAAFGDVVIFGSTTTVFALSDNNLVGWSVDTRSVIGFQELAASGSGGLALYRPANVDQDGGPTTNYTGILFGELTSPVSDYHYGANVYLRVIGDPENTADSITLPIDWYTSSTSHVEVNSYLAGLDIGVEDFAALTGIAYAVQKEVAKYGWKAIFKGLGGPVGLAILIVDLATSTNWDSSYIVRPGPGIPITQPVPTPP